MRQFFGWIAMLLGAWLGWTLAVSTWHAMYLGGIYRWGSPPLPLRFWLMALSWSVAGSVVGLAIARWRDLPVDEG